VRGATVELPKLKRSRGGWVLYRTGEDGICPYHQFCAYSGGERGLCAKCHSSWHATEDHGDLPPRWLAVCLCSSCGELFKSRSGFDTHRVRDRCRNPARRGLVLVEKTDRYGDVWQMWAKPGSRPDDI
jgi:hypothetical protein